jgi:lactoylglutathione lyase
VLVRLIPARQVTFIHPKGNEKTPLSGEGVLIELVQAPKSVIDAYDKP